MSAKPKCDYIRREACLFCGRPLLPKQIHHYAKYCSGLCAKRAERATFGDGYYRRQHLPASSKGALSELLVCADLTMRGYEVFRAVSPCASTDLIVLGCDGKAIRVEVKTGLRIENGKVRYTKPANPCDVVAVALSPTEIQYIGTLPGPRYDPPAPSTIKATP